MWQGYIVYQGPAEDMVRFAGVSVCLLFACAGGEGMRCASYPRSRSS